MDHTIIISCRIDKLSSSYIYISLKCVRCVRMCERGGRSLKIDGSHDFQGDAVVVVGLVAEGKKDLSRCFSRFIKVAVVKQLVAVDALRLKCRDRVREGVLALLELRDVDRAADLFTPILQGWSRGCDLPMHITRESLGRSSRVRGASLGEKLRLAPGKLVRSSRRQKQPCHRRGHCI